MLNEVSIALTHTHTHSLIFDAVISLPLRILLFFFSTTVSYLVIFHIFLAMFIWAYWKTIWSKPANPSKAVSLLLSHSSLSGREEINKTLNTFLFLLSVQSTQSREGAVWERRASWGPTSDSEESGEEFTRVHTHNWRRYGFRYSVVSDCALFCFTHHQGKLC